MPTQNKKETYRQLLERLKRRFDDALPGITQKYAHLINPKERKEMSNPLIQLFDPRGVTSTLDLCACGEPRQANSAHCIDCLLDKEQEEGEIE